MRRTTRRSYSPLIAPRPFKGKTLTDIEARQAKEKLIKAYESKNNRTYADYDKLQNELENIILQNEAYHYEME